MKDYHKQNIEDALQTVAKLEILLKMVDIPKCRDLDEITDILWLEWKKYNEKEPS